ncbi:hypothetical protein [Enterococcus rotai]|uniref:hypothetical protein n=1 Tax=Enterococcus rotai TaxID=118060 RepID=UPI0032B41837
MMIDYLDINLKNDIKNITRDSIYRDNWFVGSALMGQNFETLAQGKYFYQQDTIWSKVTNLVQINPYWEIHNTTYNYLLVNQNSTEKIEFFDLFYFKIKENFGLENENFIFVTTDNLFKEYCLSNKITCVDKEVPFSITKKKVGEYLKVFVIKDSKCYPLLDCTNFSFNTNVYFEMNVNNFYLELFKYLSDEQIYPKKVTRFHSFFDESSSYNKLMKYQDSIRLVSLLDCLIFFSKNNCSLDSKYSGHVVKKTLKDFFFYSKVTNRDPFVNETLLHPNYLDFLRLEEKKYIQTYPRLIKKYDLKKLSETYGMDEKTVQLVEGGYNKNKFEVFEDTVRYFTDIPFINGKKTMEEYTRLIEKIIERKK